MGKETLTLTLYCDLHWSEISKAIFSNKKKPQGWWCGDKGTEKDAVSRQAGYEGVVLLKTG